MQRTLFYALMCPLAACFTFASCTRVPKKERSAAAPPLAVMSAAPVSATTSASTAPSQVLPKPEDLNDKFSYTYGFLLFQALAKQGFDDLDAQYFAQGALDAKNGNPLFSQGEMEETLRTVQQQLLSRAKTEYEALAAEHQKEADAFFAENGKRDGVVTMEDGIQYQVLDSGDETKPLIGLDDTVVIDYTITMLDGTLLVGTSQRGHSDVFTVDTLSSGFLKDGIQLLHPGAHYRFWVPYPLVAASGYLPQLEPNAAIIVDLEIKEVRYAGAAS